MVYGMACYIKVMPLTKMAIENTKAASRKSEKSMPLRVGFFHRTPLTHPSWPETTESKTILYSTKKLEE